MSLFFFLVKAGSVDDLECLFVLYVFSKIKNLSLLFAVDVVLKFGYLPPDNALISFLCLLVLDNKVNSGKFRVDKYRICL
jgi:hypothetical protein